MMLVMRMPILLTALVAAVSLPMAARQQPWSLTIEPLPSPAGAGRSCATTDPRLGWKLTNAPHPTGMRGGAPVIM